MHEIIQVDISRLREYEYNPRNNELAVDKVKASIERFGFLFPVIIDLNYIIVCGHTRVRACKESGITRIPCIMLSNLTQEQIDFFRLVDNKTSEYSSWDFDKLKAELALIDLNIQANQLILDVFDLNTAPIQMDIDLPDIRIDSINFDPVTVGGNDADVPPPSDSYEPQDIYEPEIRPDYTTGESPLPVQNHGNTQGDSRTATNAIHFRFGEIRFFISDCELQMLNAAYALYMDVVYPNKTFVEFMLEGR